MRLFDNIKLKQLVILLVAFLGYKRVQKTAQKTLILNGINDRYYLYIVIHFLASILFLILK